MKVDVKVKKAWEKIVMASFSLTEIVKYVTRAIEKFRANIQRRVQGPVDISNRADAIQRRVQGSVEISNRADAESSSFVVCAPY